VSTEQETEEVEVEFVEIEVTDEQIEIEAKGEQPRAHIIVDNLDDGQTIRFWAAFNLKIEQVIKRMYKHFDLDRHPGDRLEREHDKKNVFPEEHRTVREYILEYGGNARIHWEFSGDTGGARR